MAWTPPAEEEKKPTGTSWTPPENEVKWTPPAEDDPENPVNEKKPWRLKKLKESGVPLSEEQEKLLWKYEEDRPLLDKAGEAVRTFFPAAAKVANQLGTGSVDLIYKGVLKPIDAMSQTPEEAKKTLKEAGNAWRSLGSGAMSDMEETIDMATRFSMFGSGITDKLQGLPEEERFKRFKNREVMRQLGQAVREEMPDRAAALISENPFLKKAAGAYAKLAGGTPEEVKMAEEAFTELVKESGLTKEELDENISMLGEFMSPVALPGANRITGAIAKPVGKVVQKTGELALRGIKPIAGAVEGAAELTLKGTELVQGGARKIGEYTTNDPDTLLRTGANTVVMPINAVAKPTSNVARVVKDVTSQVDVGGAAGRRGLFERAGRAETSSDLTRRLFGPQGKGGVARAKVADWTVRQANAIIQPGVNGAALNVLMGLPDIETGAQLGEVAGTGFGIGGFAGARVFDRAGAIIDPTTSLAEKITTVVTPDMAQRRRDEDADIKRFIATATPEMKSQMADLSNIDKRKTAIDSKLINLRQQKERTINAADEANLQRQIDGFEKQRQALDKATPETVREAERQVQLAFVDAMDLAQATGTSAGLRGLNLTVLDADNAEGFFRNLYGGAVERAEGVVDLLTGRTDLTMQESQNLQQARELLNRFSTEVAGAKNQRGFAIGVDGTDPNAEGYVPPHLRKVNQTGATAVINGDLVKHLSEQGFDVRRVINHEMQHALQQFREVKDMLSPIRGDLFDQKVVKDDGTVEVWKQGIFSDADIARYGANYAAKMSPADNGASFIAQFQDVDAFTAYIKDEILAEVASQTGDYSNGTRAALDDVGRNLVDWLEVKTKAGALRKMKEGLRTFGIVFDNYGGYSNVLGADLPPEALAMIRQYQRQLRDFDGSMQIQTTREEDAPDIPMTAILGSRALQEKYKDADFFEKEQILRSTAPDGTVTEIVMPKGAKLDPFVDIYRIQGGQLVDANGNPVQLPPEITFGSLPEGSTFQMDTRIARKPDGSPITLSAREIKSRALERTQSIRNVIDSAPDDGTPNRLIDTGNGNYRGVMSPSQLAAVLSIPNNVLAPALKRQIQFFNELMQRGDGTRAIFEYQAALLNGKYKAIAPKIRDEVPIGWQFTKDGNFALTTMSVSRLYDKLQAWADQGTVTQEQTWTGELIPVKRSKNLALWNGDTNKFWNSLVQVLDNHANGREGWVGLHSDELTAKRMRNKVNDLFNVFNKETKEMNPDRSTLPRVRGRDNVDIIVRSRRVDRINSFSESPSTKVPVNYGKLLINYMPETNPLAAPQTPEQFMENINGSVSATRIRNAIATGAVDQLESELRNSDDLLPTESLFVSQGEGGDPLIQVTSMLDPNVEGALEPEEVVVDLDAQTAAELARLEEAEQAAAAEQQAALAAQQAQAEAEQQVNQEVQSAIEAEARDNERYRTSLEERIRSGVAFSNAIVAPAGIQFLPAFHGSPHDFDKFNIGKIGTGEGQQAFGYGLYFAGAKAVGEGYRAKLARDIRVDGVVAPNEEIIKNQQINDLLGILTDALKARKNGLMPDRKNINRAIRMLEDEKEASVDNTYAEEILNWWFNSGSKGLKDPSKIQYGTLYKVELNVDDSNLLDWDKPLSEQSKTVQEAVLPTIVSELDKIQKARQAVVQRGTRLGGLPFRPGELEKLQKPMPNPLSLTGRAAYVYVTNTFGGRPYEDSPKASDFLLSRGIAGIRYFDAMSRGAGEGTHNYVIFDDKLITVLEKNDKPVGPVIQFMPAEAPSGERGFQSKLQLEIQKKFKGAIATPEQLKAVLGNPQNVKPEEVKWSGVMDEIDRLAQENNGKVPVQELLNYLRNEGQVKFEEVTFGENRSIEDVADLYRIKIEKQFGEAAFYDEFDEPLEFDELPFPLQNAIDKAYGRPEPKYAQYQLPGGENYREVVLSMPETTDPNEEMRSIVASGENIIIRGESLNWKDAVNKYIGGTEGNVLIKTLDKLDADQRNRYIERELVPDIRIKLGAVKEQYQPFTSIHFPEAPNYIAHMRLNERTDAEGNPGLFVEEFQSDRHQAGRESGYIEEKGINAIPEGYELIDENQSAREAGYDVPLDAPPRWSFKGPGYSSRIYNSREEAIEGTWKIHSFSGNPKLVPDAPFRKDWGVQLFKRALRDAVESGKSWIGWTTGDTQAERYDLSKQVDQIAVHQRADMVTNEKSRSVFIQLPVGDGSFTLGVNNNAIIDNTDASSRDMLGKNLADVVGKEMAQKIMDAKSGTILKGDDLKIGGEGMKGFYDQILPKEIGKYVAKMGGRVEKSEVQIRPEREVESPIGLDDEPLVKMDAEYVPMWRVNITPEMENVVRAGQIQFMPADSDAEYLRLAQDPEANQEKLQRMVDDVAKSAGGIQAWHFGSFDPQYNPIPITKNGMHFGSEEAARQRGFEKQPEGERRSLEVFEEDGSWFWKTQLNESLDGFPSKKLAEIDANNAIAEMWVNQDFDLKDLGNMTKTYLFLKNPKNVKDQGDNWNDAIIKAKQEGYDGLKYRNEFEDKGSTSYVIFNPEQAKSADPVTYDNEGNVIPLSQRFQTTSPDIRFMPEEQGPLADIQAPEQTKTEPLVPKTLQTDAGDFSVVIGGKPGKYGFGYTTVTELQPKLELSQQRKKELLETLTPRNDELSKKRDALLDVGNTWWENDDLIAKPNRNEEDMKRLEETSQFLQEFMAKEDKEFTLDDAIQVAQVNRLTKKINELQKQLTPAPFKFPADRDVALKSLQSTVATIFKTKKFKDFIEGATGVSNIQFNNIFGTWKFDPEPSFVFSAPGMTWEQSQVVTKWLSFLMTQDAGIAWKPSIGLTDGVSSVYLIHDKKLTEAQILKAFEKAKEVGIDGLSLTVDGKGIKGANFDGIEGFYDKLAEIQKAAGIKNAHETLVDSFYYDTTSDFTAEDGSTRVPDWLKGESINEKNTQDQQGGSDETGGIGGDNTSTRGLTVLLRGGIDSILIPYAKALAGEGFIFDPDLFAQRYGLGQEVADYIREQLYPKKGLSRSVTPILEGTEKFVVPESFYTKDGKLKTSVNDLMYALQRRSADDGFIAPGDYSPQAGKIISETIVDEVLGHIERAKKNQNAPNAIGWYDAALKRMKKEYAKYFPFLNRNSKDYNPDKEFVFDSVLGITSQGNNVFENGKMAARVQFLLENGKTLPEVVADLYDTFGGQTRAIENNLLKLDQLLKNNETQTLDKIFRKKMTVSEWNAYLKKNKNLWYDGKPLSVDGQADQMVTGFSVFGPKIGSFINNLHGDYSTLTADLWFTRTWNRILGNVFQHASLKEANQYDSFRDALIEQYRKYLAKNYAREFKPLVKKTKKDGEEKTFEYRNEPELDGLSEMDFAELINDPQKLLDFATTLEDRFRTGQYKQKSDLRRAAKNWVENRSDPVAAPRTDLERDFQQNVMEIAQKKLRKMGIDISIADMQAALWYNEKELFGLYGAQVSGAEPADYADSAENVSELLSYGTLFQLERQVEQADGTKKKEIIRLVPYDAELGLTKIENAKTPEQYSRLVAARKKAADDAKKAGKKLEKAEAKVEEKTQELARINPADEKAKQKAESELAKAKQVLADLKLPATDAPLTEIKPPLE